MWRGTIASASALILINVCLAAVEGQQQSYPQICGTLARSVLQNERTWMAQIFQVSDNNETIFTCDGALIDSEQVLITRDAVDRLDADKTIVVIGGKNIRIEKIIYRKNEQESNFAILVLSEKLLNPEFKPISLPEKDTKFETCNCFVVNVKPPALTISATTVTGASYRKCVRPYNNICTANIRGEACGTYGLLVCPSRNNGTQYVLAGIQTSPPYFWPEEWTIPCTPIFTNTAHERTMIDNKFANHTENGLEVSGNFSKPNKTELQQQPNSPQRCGTLARSVLYNERSWMAQIFQVSGNNETRFACDGALIDSEQVLISRDAMDRLDVNKTIVVIGGKNIKVEKIMYDENKRGSNFAILVLSEKLLNPEFKPISLPEQDTKFESCNCFIVNVEPPAFTISATTVTGASNRKCVRPYNNICTRNFDWEACGTYGLLVCPSRNNGTQYVLAGIQNWPPYYWREAWTISCTPIFTSTAHERKMIDNKFENRINVTFNDSKNVGKPIY